MKFYKITNKEEIHNGMEYKTGLNEDIIPFNPSGNCASGGIYFACEDIFSFLNYGPWIRGVSLPEGEEVYENPVYPKKWKSHRVILGERRKIDLEVIKELVEEGADVHADNDRALRWAAKNGLIEIVKFLIEQGADVHAVDDCALKRATQYGHLEVVKYLIEHGANVSADDNSALEWASNNGHLEIVKYLIEHGNRANIFIYESLKLASVNGHGEVVEYLEHLNNQTITK